MERILEAFFATKDQVKGAALGSSGRIRCHAGTSLHIHVRGKIGGRIEYAPGGDAAYRRAIRTCLRSRGAICVDAFDGTASLHLPDPITIGRAVAA